MAKPIGSGAARACARDDITADSVPMWKGACPVPSPRGSSKVVAAAIVVCWVGMSWRMGGLALAVRAALLFMIPLTMVCLPDHMARIAGIASRRSCAPNWIVTPGVVRFVGWFVILGVPAGWIALWRATTGS